MTFDPIAMILLGLGRSGVPGAASLAVVDNGDGTATATVSGTDDDDTNDLYIRELHEGSYTLEGTRTGNGTIAITEPTGTYYGYIKTTNEAGESTISPVVRFSVTDAERRWLEEFRVLLRAWLVNISGMSAQVSTRVTYQWPAQAPERPFIIYAVNRDPITDYPRAAWMGEVMVTIYHPNGDTLDAIETLIMDSFDDEEIVKDDLTGSKVQCADFHWTRTERDIPSFSPEGEKFAVMERTLVFAFTIVSLELIGG